MLGVRILTVESAFLALLLASAIGCGSEPAPPEYVARVGDAYLLRADVDRAMSAVPAGPDSLEVRQQIIEQWVSSEVLHQEALRRGLPQDPDVQRLLQESERSVLVNALVSQLYEQHDVAPTPSEIQAYFERYRDQLRLREPFVRVRYLATTTVESAEEVRRRLQQAALADRDSVFALVRDQLPVGTVAQGSLSVDYHPESRLFGDHPALREALANLSDGQTAPVITADSTFHVLQLAERVPAGTLPEPSWIDDELRRRLIIQGRKQLYARQVQRLRNEALAREDLEVR